MTGNDCESGKLDMETRRGRNVPLAPTLVAAIANATKATILDMNMMIDVCVRRVCVDVGARELC